MMRRKFRSHFSVSICSGLWV